MCTAKLMTGLLILLLLSAAHALAGPLPAVVLERLRADHAALVEAERDFRWRRTQGLLGAAEAVDYAAYVERLRDRVAQDCLALVDGDFAPLPPDLPCAAFPSTGPAAASIDTRAEQTPHERTATLDAELDTALGEFDEMLLREQERVKAATPRSADSGGGGGGLGGAGEAGGGGSQAGGEDGQQGEPGEMADAGSTAAGGTSDAAGSASGQAGSGGRGGREGAPGQAGTRGQPADVPDGSDDDVVARQLREAAEKEKDPELKKKLWEEYRKYKQGIR
jgi:hypothetical protein